MRIECRVSGSGFGGIGLGFRAKAMSDEFDSDRFRSDDFKSDAFSSDKFKSDEFSAGIINSDELSSHELNSDEFNADASNPCRPDHRNLQNRSCTYKYSCNCGEHRMSRI